MVYCGLPSKACGNCRAKKLRCDQAQPACTQCRRGKRQCSGYRNELDLCFRDQTQAVITRVQGIKPATIATISAPQFSNYQSPDALTLPLHRTLSVAPLLESIALYNFIEQYDLLPSFCPGAISGRGGRREAKMLSEVAIALGLIPLSNNHRDKQVVHASRTRYASALRLTNAALCDPKQAVADETLMTIMLLALYETVTCETPESMRSWNIHFEGACRLLQLRGTEQFQSKLGLELFTLMRTRILSSFLWAHRDIPQSLIVLIRQAQAYQSLKDAAVSQLALMITEMSAFSNKLGRGLPADMTHDDVLTFWLLLDERLELWESNLPHEYSKRRVSCDADYVFGEHFDLYQDTTAAFALNNYRCVRKTTNDQILATLPHGPASEHRRAVSEGIIRSVVADVCATMPYLLDGRRSENDVGTPPTIATGNMVLKALCVLSYDSHEYETLPGLWTWCCAQLARVHKTTGSEQAKFMVDLLKARIDTRAFTI